MSKHAHSIDPEKLYWSKSNNIMVMGKDLTASDVDSLYHEANLEPSKQFETYGLSDGEIDEALLRAARYKNAHESLQKLYKLAEKETGMTSIGRYVAMDRAKEKRTVTFSISLTYNSNGNTRRNNA